MKVFVLTQKEGSSSTPVDVTSSQTIANDWFARGEGNDWFQFELDKLNPRHFAQNGPGYDSADVEYEIPTPPVLDEENPVEALRGLSRFLHSLSGSMEVVARAVRR